MQDDNDASLQPPPSDDPRMDPLEEPEREYPVDRVRRRFQRRLGGRPLMVYLVLFAGAVVLLILLAIIWLSATDNDNEQPPPCFDITVADAQAAIRDGAVDEVEIFLDQDRPELGPSVIRILLTDGTCRELPKGADNIDLAYLIIGFVEVYNSTHEQRVRVSYRRTDVLPELLMTSTPTPTFTPTPLPTETPTATAVATETVIATETPTLIAISTDAASPVASDGTPIGE